MSARRRRDAAARWWHELILGHTARYVEPRTWVDHRSGMEHGTFGGWRCSCGRRWTSVMVAFGRAADSRAA